MATPKLQGLTKAMDMLEHDLELGAGDLLTKIEDLGARGKAALMKGHQRVDGVASRVSEVEKFVTILEGNGGDPLDGSSNSSGDSAKTGQSGQAAEAVVMPGEAAKPEELTVNGISKTA